MAAPPTPSIPSFKLPVVDAGGFATQAWRQFWTGLGMGAGATGDTIYVNPGTGTNTRLLNAALADYANVNDYLSNGDANYDGAFARALSDKGKVYVPRNPWLGGRTYNITVPIEINDGQAIFGDGGGITQIEQQTTDIPAIFINDDIYDFQIRNLWVSHAGTPIANGDGIAQGQGLHSWVNGGLISDVWTFNCYRGFNLGKAFSGTIQNCFANGSIERGIAMTSTGVSEVGVTPQNGPLQWVLEGCGVGESGSDAFAYLSTATGAAFSAPISCGTLRNCSTFGNAGNGVAAYGNAAGPIFSVRIEGGFYGQDAGHEIHLDTWGNGHVLRPTEIELAGACGVHITGNGTNSNFQNSRTIIEVGLVNGCGLEGVFSQAPNTKINGGFFTNNGLSSTSSRQNAIQIFSGGGSNPASGSIVGVDAYDTGAGTQLLGIASNVDGLLISACNLVGNITAPIALPTIVNTIITGCLPQSINQQVFGNITAATITATSDLISTGNTHLTGTGVAISGGVTVVSGGMTFSTTSGAGGNGLQVDDINVNYSVGIGTITDGLLGHLSIGTAAIIGVPTGGFTTGSLNVANDLRINNTAVVGFSGSYTGNVTFTGDLTVTGQTKTQDLWVTRSVGITTPPDGVGGHIAGTPLAFTGASINMTGALAVTGNVQMASLYATVSAGIGTPPSGTTGRLDATTGIFSGGVQTVGLTSTAGVAVGGALTGATSGAFSGGLSGVTTLSMSGTISGATTITASSDIISTGGTLYSLTAGVVCVNLALTGGIYNPAAVGSLLGPGTINVSSGLFVNSVPH